VSSTQQACHAWAAGARKEEREQSLPIQKGYKSACAAREKTYHSRSLYMIVKKTWRKRLTAFMSTAKRYNHASPDILAFGGGETVGRFWFLLVDVSRGLD
jgi:hypothetical protein